MAFECPRRKKNLIFTLLCPRNVCTIDSNLCFLRDQDLDQAIDPDPRKSYGSSRRVIFSASDKNWNSSQSKLPTQKKPVLHL
jgi:hypothetical protein